MIPPCPVPEVPPTHFEVVAPHAPVVLELREVDEALLAELERRGIRATLVLTVEEAPLGVEAAMRGHELALDLDPGLSPEQLAAWPMESWWDAGRDELRAFKKATGIKPSVVRVPSLSKRGELAMSQLKVATVLVDAPGRPHLAETVDGTRGNTLVLPMGDYQCAELNIFTLDLVAEASEEATPRGLPAVRVVVDGQPTEVLVDWLDDGWLRVGGPTIVASEVPHALPDPSVKMVVPGRKVDREDLLAAVIPLTEGGRLPRSLPRDLNLTEAFLGLVLLLSEDIEEVALTPLEAPIAAARSMDPGSVASEDVRAAAVRLAPALTTAIPGFVDVGPVKLTAEEFLVVMAIVALDPDAERVDVPVVESPDPYANGLGWGRSGP